MADPHYLDNNVYGARMGAAFSDAVTGIMRLKLAEQQRQDQQNYNLAQFRLAQQRLGLEQEKEKREASMQGAENTRQQSIYDAARSGSDAMARMYALQETAPTIANAQQMNIQDIARSLAFVRGINPAAAGRALEPQQFSPGPVYDWNALLPGAQQPVPQLPSGFGQIQVPMQDRPRPIMNVPPPEMTPYQQQMEQQRNIYNQILLQRMLMSQEQGATREAQGNRRLDIEQQRANQAQNKNPLNALIQQGIQGRLGTNKVGRFSIRPKVTDNSEE